MADPEVLHTNPNVPQDEDGTGSEAIFAGLNDEHILLTQAQTLVGNSEILDGAAEAIIPILPLVIANRQLYLDQTSFNALTAGLQAQITALQAQATADEANIAANTAAIAANAAAANAAIAANSAAITALQQQMSILTQRINDVIGSLKPASFYPYGDATLNGAGAVLARFALTSSISNLANLAGAGTLAAELGKVPWPLFPANFLGAGSLTAAPAALSMLSVPGWSGLGQIFVNALVKSLYILPGQWGPIAGAGQLVAPSLAMLRLLTLPALSGAGALGALVNMPMIAGSTFTGAGAVLPTNLMKVLGGVSFAGAGNIPAVAATIPPHTVQLDAATNAGSISIGAGTATPLVNIGTGNAALVVLAYTNGAKGDISSGVTATWGSQAMTLVGNYFNNSAQMQFLFFGLLAPATTGGRITVTVAGMSTVALYNSVVTFSCITFNNVNQSALTTAFNNFNSSSAAGTTLSLSIASPNSNSVVVAVSGSTGTSAPVSGVDHTQWFILNGSSMSCSGQYAASAGTSTTVAVSYTAAPLQTAMYGLSVNN